MYEEPDGVLVLSIIEGSGAEKAGIQPNDIIFAINGIDVRTPLDFQKVEVIPGQTVIVSVLRNGQELEFPVLIMPSEDDPERGLIGIMRDNSFAYKPIYNFIEWNNPTLSMFLLWLWMISFFIGIINMLPLPILDGGKFIHSIIDKKISERSVNGLMWGIYAFTFALFGLNIALSYIKSGWFTI
jgi:membrane-associated protease RseP (regulator of RpoE activity)